MTYRNLMGRYRNQPRDEIFAHFGYHGMKPLSVKVRQLEAKVVRLGEGTRQRNSPLITLVLETRNDP